MAEVSKYPVSPVLLCLRHVSGSVNSTSISSLLNYYIDSQFVTVTLSSINATIIEVVFILHLQMNPTDAFGGITRSILNQIMGCSDSL